MKRGIKYLATVVLMLLILTLGFTGGLVFDRTAHTVMADTNPNNGALNLGLITQAWQIVQSNYADRTALDATRLTYGAISGMVEALGDTGHSTFLTPEMLKQHNNYTRGSFEGIGAQVEKKGETIVIVAPMDNSPALKGGVHPGDIILKVDGVDITGQTLDQVIERILGPAGTQVTLTLADPKSGDQRDLTLTRAKIDVNNVSWAPVPGTTIAVVRLAGFSDGVTNDLKKALVDINQQHMTGVILDLRNNPGGLLSEAVGTASQFLKSGTVLEEKDAQGKVDSVSVQSGGVATDIPMTVLINYGTASASEIVSGALQDEGRAKLVGDTTFGTGTVLNQFGLPDGSALLLATEQWLTPNGRVIWHKGITPDEKVTLPTGVSSVSADTLRTLSATDMQNNKDTQLQRAIELLSCPNGTCGQSTGGAH